MLVPPFFVLASQAILEQRASMKEEFRRVSMLSSAIGSLNLLLKGFLLLLHFLFKTCFDSIGSNFKEEICFFVYNKIK